ncbi:MAG: hypothetical protein M0Q40_06090 [Limnochordia bacterium]|jgi:hypothetical protein|nr:hypothetical protein [Limnochordia bacterium]MDD4517412.1 sugar-binding protein [Limnochordia bacterium]
MRNRICLFASCILLLVLSVVPAMAEKNPNKAIGYFFEQAPTIDGDLSEWNLAKPAVVIEPGSNVMKGDLESAADLTLKLYVGWDYEYLYIAVDALDDSVLGTFDLSDYWAQDRVNLCFDALNDSTLEAYGKDNPGSDEWQDDDYWVYFHPFGGDEEEGLVTIMCNTHWTAVADAEIAAVRTDDGYRTEVKLPIVQLPELWIEEGTVIGFDVFVTDGDVNDWGELVMSEIMWGGFDYPEGGGIRWQYWKVGALEFVVE